jgi:hypothetical protein
MLLVSGGRGGGEDAEHILLKFSETNIWRQEFCNIWLSLINCTNVIDLKTLRNIYSQSDANGSKTKHNRKMSL